VSRAEPRHYVANEFRELRPNVEPRPELSLVAPVFDEEQNLEPLYDKVAAALAGRRFELVLVDDGSRDRSAAIIRALHERDPRVRGVFFTRNRGQTAAMAAGIHAAAGELIATLDADLQNDPADIPRLVAALDSYDAAVGYRMQRHDTWVRRMSSKIANGVRNRLTGDQIRDTGCSLKVFRADAVRALPFFEGMHRFLPTLLRMHGFTVVEVGVSHHPRVAGLSKYGIRNRALRALRDTFAVRWMRSRLIRIEIAEVHAPAGTAASLGTSECEVELVPHASGRSAAVAGSRRGSELEQR
jgi:dolichol-phosphate mannosyltransferase